MTINKKQLYKMFEEANRKWREHTPTSISNKEMKIKKDIDKWEKTKK